MREWRMPRRKSTAANRVLKLDDFLPFLLSTASNAVSNLVARTYHTRFGLNIPQWRITAVLAETQGLTQQALCDRTLMDKVTVSRASQALLSRGLVARSPNSQDGRSHMLMLTAEGRRLFNEVAPAALAIEQRLFEAFSDRDMKQFAAFLNRIRNRAESLSGGEPEA
jgi:DNA-binding MarR family transcriptional regulator